MLQLKFQILFCQGGISRLDVNAYFHRSFCIGSSNLKIHDCFGQTIEVWPDSRNHVVMSKVTHVFVCELWHERTPSSVLQKFSSQNLIGWFCSRPGGNLKDLQLRCFISSLNKPSSAQRLLCNSSEHSERHSKQQVRMCRGGAGQPVQPDGCSAVMVLTLNICEQNFC